MSKKTADNQTQFPPKEIGTDTQNRCYTEFTAVGDFDPDAVVANQMRKCSTAPNKINILSYIRRENVVEFYPEIVPHVYARGKSPSFLLVGYHRFLSRNARGDRHRPLRLQFGG